MVALSAKEGRSWRRESRRWAVALTTLVVGLGACGAGTPATRGFGSHQVLQIRDSTFFFNGGFGPTSIGFSTSADGGTALLTLDLTTDRVQPYTLPDGGTTGGGGYDDCELALGNDPTGSGSLTVTDAQTGQKTTVDNVVSILSCPNNASPALTALRSDATGALTLWSGPFDNLQPVALPITLVQAVRYYSGLFLAAFPAQPSALGLFRIDPISLSVTEIVPPQLGTAAWASGATSAGSLASSTVVGTVGDLQGSVSTAGGHYTYARTMDDGSTILFAGLFSSSPASELALFQIAPAADVLPFSTILSETPTARKLVPVAAWQYEATVSQGLSLLVWNDAVQQLVVCPEPSALSDFSAASADGTKILFGVNAYSFSYSYDSVVGAPLMLVDLAEAAQGGPGTCTFLSTEAAYADFSPDGSAVAWLVQPPTGDATLWTAASDGSGRRMIGSGNVTQPHFAVGTELEFELGGDLVWVDTNDTSNTLHYVAEQVFGTAVDLEDPSVVTGYQFSSQDATGLLGLVNRDTGVKRLISPEVSTYVAQYPSGSGALPDAGAPARQIAYLVRGRNPSSQDGIWVASIGESDLQ
jgi:hypothetical protein